MSTRKTAKAPELQAAIEEAFGDKPDTTLLGDAATTEAWKLISPSASKTDLYLTCAWPWGRKAPTESVGPEAVFGSAFHELIADALDWKMHADKPGARPMRVARLKAIAKQYNVRAPLLEARFDAAFSVLWKWLKGGNAYGVDFTADMEVEKSYALHLENGYARRIASPTVEGHVYEDVEPGELPGTVDLRSWAIVDGERRADGNRWAEELLLILDHKSGFTRQDVSESGQLKTLAAAVLSEAEMLFESQPKYRPDTRIVLAFLHAPEHMDPEVYALEVDLEELQAHVSRLQLAYVLSDEHRGGKSLTPTLLCARCPAFSICPTNTSGLMDLRGGVGKLALTTPEAVGLAHQTLKTYESRFEALRKVVDADIRDAVDRLGFGIRPDGQTLEFQKKPSTNLSLASIRRNLPAKEAEKLIAKLDKMGVVEHDEREELRATRKGF